MFSTEQIVREWLACPRDKSQLRLDGESVKCEHEHSYPIIEGVPILLMSEVEQTHIEGMRALAIAESGDASSLPKFQASTQ